MFRLGSFLHIWLDTHVTDGAAVGEGRLFEFRRGVDHNLVRSPFGGEY